MVFSIISGKTLEKKQSKPFRFLQWSIFLVIFVCFIGCHKKDTETSFNARLSAIDVLINSGKEKKATQNLNSLQKKAKSSRQWLSLIKRYTFLQRNDLALEASTEALARQPANEMLSGVKAFLLVENHELEKAYSFFTTLSNSNYKKLAAYTALSYLNETPLAAQNIETWHFLWETLKNPVYLQNAISVCAYTGDLRRAFLLAEELYSVESTTTAYLMACLALDLDKAEYAVRVLSPLLEDATQNAIPMLLADAYIKTNEIDKARSLWKVLIGKNFLLDAQISFNVALSAQTIPEKRKYLNICLSSDPCYYPALLLLASDYTIKDSTEPFDFIELELKKSGFNTVSMEQKKQNIFLSYDEILNHLNTAIKQAGNADFIPLKLLQLEFINRYGQDANIQAQLWNLLEKYPDSKQLKEYCLGYFTQKGFLDIAYELNNKEEKTIDPILKGVYFASQGKLTEAEKEFQSCAGNKDKEWLALANLGLIAEKKQDYALAIEHFSLAAARAPQNEQASKLHYEVARILANTNNKKRSIDVLSYALQLNPDNYKAEQLLRLLKSQ